MSNYLQLCQEFVRELGIAGGGANNPTAVVGQTGELLNVVTWIAAAEHQINNQTMNWKYLWAEYSEALSVGDQDPPSPSSPRARVWVKDAFFLDKGGVNQRKLEWESWDYFRQSTTVPAQPQVIGQKPNGALRLDAPMTLALTLTGEYYKAPTKLAANGDVPAMPAEFHRIILCRAAVIYGGREDAPEIVNHYEPEYIELLDKLEMDQKPERAQEGDPGAYDHVEQVIPGFEQFGEYGHQRGQ